MVFWIFYGLSVNVTAQNLLIFMEFLSRNQLSHRVIRNYLSSLSSMAQFYGLDTSHLSHPAVSIFLRSLSINSSFRPSPRGIFDIRTLYHISKACDSLPDPYLFRAIFLVAFYAFLRISKIAPHSNRQFSHSLGKTLYLLLQGLICSYNGPRPYKTTTPHIWFKSLALITYFYAQLEQLSTLGL